MTQSLLVPLLNKAISCTCWIGTGFGSSISKIQHCLVSYMIYCSHVLLLLSGAGTHVCLCAAVVLGRSLAPSGLLSQNYFLYWHIHHLPKVDRLHGHFWRFVGSYSWLVDCVNGHSDVMRTHVFCVPVPITSTTWRRF